MFRILPTLALAALIAGCGQKGPLYLPEDKPVAKKAAKTAPASSAAQDKAQTQ